MGLNENDKDDLIRYWYLDWDGVLTEEDFYPIPDDRFHSCGVDDIPDGDNYLEFAKEFYELYEEDLFG